MKRSGLSLLLLIVAAAIVLILFVSQMKKNSAVTSPSGGDRVQQAQEVVDALNDRIKQSSYPGE